MKFSYNWPGGFFYNMLKTVKIRVLGQRSKKDLDLLYQSLHVLIKTKANTNFLAIVFKTFLEILCSSIFTYLTLPLNRSMSTKGHLLNNFDST